MDFVYDPAWLNLRRQSVQRHRRVVNPKYICVYCIYEYVKTMYVYIQRQPLFFFLQDMDFVYDPAWLNPMTVGNPYNATNMTRALIFLISAIAICAIICGVSMCVYCCSGYAEIDKRNAIKK